MNNIKSIFTRHQQKLPVDQLGLNTNHQFSEKRLSDFSTGRYCAKKALDLIEIHDVIIPIGKVR